MDVLGLPAKTLGLGVSGLLFVYAIVIAYSSRYERVDNRYATAFSTVALVVWFVAIGGILNGSFDELLEVAGYLLGAVGGTAAFFRITKRKSHFEEA